MLPVLDGMDRVVCIAPIPVFSVCLPSLSLQLIEEHCVLLARVRSYDVEIAVSVHVTESDAACPIHTRSERFAPGESAALVVMHPVRRCPHLGALRISLSVAVGIHHYHRDFRTYDEIRISISIHITGRDRAGHVGSHSKSWACREIPAPAV